MRLVLALLVALAPWGGAALAQEAAAPERRLTVGVLRETPPYSSLGRYGARTGFDVDVARAVCGRIGARCALVPLGADEVIRALAERRVDAAFAQMAPAPALEGAVDFTAPYLSVALRFVAPREPRAGREGPPVVATLADSAEAALVGEGAADAVTARVYPSAAEMWIDLAMGRLDAVLAPAIAARRDFLATPLGQGFRFEVPEGEPRRAVAVTLRDGDAALRREWDRAITDLVASPEYGEILQRHLPVDLARAP